MKLVGLIVIFILLLVQSTYSLEPETVTIACPEWDKYTNSDGTGVYWEVVKEIFEPVNITVITKSVPWARAKYLVERKFVDAILGDYFYPEKSGQVYLYPKWHISVEEPVAALFKKENFKDWNSQKLNLFKNRKIAWVREYGFEQTLFKEIAIVQMEINSLVQGLKMLKHERIDALIDYRSSIKSMMVKLDMKLEPDYRFETAQEGNLLFVAFSNTNRSKKLIKIFDRRMTELVKNGRIHQIYKKWGFGKEKFGMERFRELFRETL